MIGEYTGVDILCAIFASQQANRDAACDDRARVLSGHRRAADP